MKLKTLLIVGSIAAAVAGVGLAAQTFGPALLLPARGPFPPVTLATPHFGIHCVLQVIENPRSGSMNLALTVENKITEQTKELRVPAAARLIVNGTNIDLAPLPAGGLGVEIPLQELLIGVYGPIDVSTLIALLINGVQGSGVLEVMDASGEVCYAVSPGLFHMGN